MQQLLCNDILSENINSNKFKSEWSEQKIVYILESLCDLIILNELK